MAAVVTLGGACSVLVYIAQQAVETFRWLQPREMLDGLGMAETMPGPLSKVGQFVGFMGAYQKPGPLSPMLGGIFGSLLTTWVALVPCFFWMFLEAPYIEQLRSNMRIRAALAAITAAAVGVVLNLTVWFSLHTLFANVKAQKHYGIRLPLPDLSSANHEAFAVTALACLLTSYWKKGLATTLSVSALAGFTL